MQIALLTEARLAFAAGRYEQAQVSAAHVMQQAQAGQNWPEAAMAWHLWVQTHFRVGGLRRCWKAGTTRL